MSGEDGYSLNGKRILVTGASSGIGRAIAILASRLGATIFCVARDSERMSETMNLLTGQGHRSRLFDLSNLKDIPSVIEGFQPIDGLVHAAGSQISMPLRLLSLDQLHKTTLINSDAALALAKSFQSSSNCTERGGAVVYISSIVAQVGVPGTSAYSYSKGALEALSRTLAVELAPKKIRVNCVAPGYVRTPMYERLAHMWSKEQRQAVVDQHPLGIGSVEDVAYAVAFLLTDRARWITGTVLTVDGGYTAR